MKKTLKYILFLSVLTVCVLLDSCVFKLFRTSLVLCVCFSIFAHNDKAIVISSMAGLLCDVVTLTLPTFSLLYLYISLGCVWCRELFLELRIKTVIFLSFLSFISFFVLCQVVNILTFTQFSFSLELVFRAILFSLVNSAYTPLIYFGFKRLKF